MGCVRFVKLSMILLNAFLALFGLTLLVLGAFIQLEYMQIFTYYMPSVAMGMGGLILLIAFFGCCSVIRERSGMLVTYSILMFLLIISTVILITMYFMKKDEVLNLMDNRVTPRSSEFGIHRMFQCCSSQHGPYDPACCSTTIQLLYQPYCQIVGFVAITLASIELLTNMFGLILINNMSNENITPSYSAVYLGYD